MCKQESPARKHMQTGQSNECGPYSEPGRLPLCASSSVLCEDMGLLLPGALVSPEKPQIGIFL